MGMQRQKSALNYLIAPKTLRTPNLLGGAAEWSANFQWIEIVARIGRSQTWPRIGS